jgi:H+-transporting ATPase
VKQTGTSEYKELPVDETLGLLNTSETGLTESEAKKRLEEFGENRIAEEKRNPLAEFFSRYWGPMAWLLELSIVLSVLLQHYLEAIIIFVLLTVNVTIGFYHASSSQKALEFLKKRLAVKAKVLRDGRWVTVDAELIVPGDIFLVGLGDLIPADAKLVSGELSLDQSALTGESLPVNVHESDVVFSSSIVSRGEAKCITVNTGKSTYFGTTAELVKMAKPRSHQEQIMLDIIKYMMYLGIAALALVTADALILKIDLLNIITFAAIFLIGAVPVALPAVLTIVQSVGAMELARKAVLVTRLDSIEDAASMDVLCLDKTGTITQNKLSIVDVTPFSGFDKEDVVATAALASKEESKDLIDLTVLAYAKVIGVDLNSCKQVSFVPFEPSTKRAEAIIESEEDRFKAVKGAPQTVLSMCNKTDEKTRESVNAAVEKLSSKGYRTIGVAKSGYEDFDTLQFAGLLSLADPIRSESKSTIEEARTLGVKPLMLTGDNINIAKEIAGQTSIGANIVRIADIKSLNETEQAQVIEESDGFAEIYPEDKYRIVKLLQSKGHVVGMTGDGVNDAPALKQAEMGIAVSNSTDVAKASASLVLTEPGVGVIIDAIKTSRQIYQRMLSWVINKVTKVVQFSLLLTVGFFWLHDVVISLLGMVLLVFANDFVTMSLATDNVKHTSNPNTWNVKNISVASLIIGMLLVVEGIAAIFIGLNYLDLQTDGLTTFVMLLLILTSQFRVYVVRERQHFWSSKPGRELLIATLGAIAVFTLLGAYGLIVQPLTLDQVLFVLGFSAVFTLSLDVPKYYVFRKFGL